MLKKPTIAIDCCNLFLESNEDEEITVGTLKKITVKHVAYWMAGAQDEITSDTFQKFRNKILKNEGTENNTNQDISEDNMLLYNLIKTIPNLRKHRQYFCDGKMAK